MRRSAVRELLKVACRPEIISFAGGLPAAELFPLGRVQAAVESIFKRVGTASLQYGETEGLADLRAWIARRHSRPHLPLGPDNVLITSGAQQALDLIGRVLLDAGDCVLVENPTYLALLSAWRPLGVKFAAAPSDSGGMCLDGFESNHPPKLVYLTPNFQNPQGTTLSLARREQLSRWLEVNQAVCVEDDPYGELRYEGSHLPSLLELNGSSRSEMGLESHVIRTGSFSKILMPGLRVGWVIAARAVIEKLVQAKQAADLHTSTLTQQVAWELVREGFLERFIPQLCSTYRERRDLMIQALETHFAGLASWTKPEGGMFLLLTLPEGYDAKKLLSSALKEKVAFVPGEEFHLHSRGRNTLRLNFSNARPEAIESGIIRLADVVRRNAPTASKVIRPARTCGIHSAAESRFHGLRPPSAGPVPRLPASGQTTRC